MTGSEKLPQLEGIHKAKPREVVGREVVARFEAQFRAAALASLQILQGKGIDFVYCDYHDDYVTRDSSGESKRYNFFQVKTKGVKKHHWSRVELFDLPKKTPKQASKSLSPGLPAIHGTPQELSRLKASFVGKLLEHTHRFSDCCNSVTFLTNAFFGDDVEKIIEALNVGNFGERTIRFICDNYDEIYSCVPSVADVEVHARIRKLVLSDGHAFLDPHHEHFDALATKAVWQYSEVDLTHPEGLELVKTLMALVQAKSSKILMSKLSVADLDSITGIGLDDLLSLLPVSRGAYLNFLKSGDPAALKNSSILQRKLIQAGASDDLIETASRWKVEWDDWFRTNRHTYEHAVSTLQLRLNSIFGKWAKGEVSFVGLEGEVETLLESQKKWMKSLLTTELLMGGVLAELVRSESR
jgi:hypothetical protein